MALLFRFCFGLSMEVGACPLHPCEMSCSPATAGLGCFAHKPTSLYEPLVCTTSSPAPCNGAKRWEHCRRAGRCRGRLNMEDGDTEMWDRAMAWVSCSETLQQAGEAGGCRSAECGSHACLLSPASASCPLGSQRPITHSQSLLQHKEDLQRIESISGFVFFFVVVFFLCPPKKLKQKDPYFKVKYIIVSNRNFKHCLFLWAGITGSITLTTWWQKQDKTTHLHLNTFSLK